MDSIERGTGAEGGHVIGAKLTQVGIGCDDRPLAAARNVQFGLAAHPDDPRVANGSQMPAEYSGQAEPGKHWLVTNRKQRPAEAGEQRRPAQTSEGPQALIPGPLHCLKRSAEAGTADQRAIQDEAAKQTQVTATGARLVKQ